MASPTRFEREDQAMALETTLTTAASTRRALLAGSLGALAAYVAQALGRPLSARATDGDVIHVGDDLSATSVTRIVNTANAENVITAESQQGVGLSGISDVQPGVSGRSSTGNGVRGTSDFGAGVSGTGEIGVSGGGTTGVSGSGFERGVLGDSVSGVGVLGSAGTGTGVRAQAGSGTALRVVGKATFSRSGRLTLAAGQSSIAKTRVSLTRYSMVLAVLQTNRAGIYVRAVVTSPSTSSFRIYLNARVPGTTNVAWFVLN
jgi:hypothetical protein